MEHCFTGHQVYRRKSSNQDIGDAQYFLSLLNSHQSNYKFCSVFEEFNKKIDKMIDNDIYKRIISIVGNTGYSFCL